MRAIEILDKRKGDASAPPDTRADDFLAACTPAQRQRAIEIVTALKELQAEVFELHPKLRPVWWRKQEPINGQPVIERDQPSRPAAEVPVAPAERPGVDETEAEREVRVPLSPTQWEQVGLFTMPNGDVTHALGDDYARNVMEGSVTFEEARQQHEARQQQLKGMNQ